MTDPKNVGGLMISEDVLAAIVINSIKDLPGVSKFVQRPPDLETVFKIGDQSLKSVKIKIKDNEVYIHVYINIFAGYKIPVLCEQIQQKIKSSVQTMTGKIVSRVDIDILGIDFSEPEHTDK